MWFLLACSAFAAIDPDHLRDGDLAFLRSRSAQSEAIARATRSDITHVGVVFHEGGRVMVLEAVEPVRVVPWEQFVAHGSGEPEVRRLADAGEVLTGPVLAAMRTQGKAWLGVRYDVGFAWSDDRLYCSELVWKLYDRHAHVQLGTLQRLGDFDLGDPVVAPVVASRYGAHVPVDEVVISPASLLADPRLQVVR